jgi:5-methylcytosine-specific restriction endonuclease McrA
VGAEPGIDAVALAQKIAALLDSAAFDTTYKLATLEALIDLVSSSIGENGIPRESFSAREISSRVLHRYWSQTANFGTSSAGSHSFLRQRSGGQGGDLVSRIAQTRIELSLTSHADTLVSARKRWPEAIKKLEDLAWERVVDMPLPRLQRFGGGSQGFEERFMYDYKWGAEGEKRHLALARKDDTISLKDGVSRGLVALQPLLRRHIEILWLQLVAEWNPNLTDAGRLRVALFGSQRQANKSLADPLADLQDGQCFYCGENFGKSMEVDHFLPWSLSRNDNIENLVVACPSCNGKKSDSLASLPYLEVWRQRVVESSLVREALAELAEKFSRAYDPHSTLGQARGLYLYAPAAQPLWSFQSDHNLLDKQAAANLLL